MWAYKWNKQGVNVENMTFLHVYVAKRKVKLVHVYVWTWMWLRCERIWVWPGKNNSCPCLSQRISRMLAGTWIGHVCPLPDRLHKQLQISVNITLCCCRAAVWPHHPRLSIPQHHPEPWRPNFSVPLCIFLLNFIKKKKRNAFFFSPLFLHNLKAE